MAMRQGTGQLTAKLQLQSVTTAGNTTTEGISIASANIASDSVTIGPTNGEIVGGYVVANAVSNTAIVWRGIQTDDTVKSEISATGAIVHLSGTVNGEPVGGGGSYSDTLLLSCLVVQNADSG